MIGLIEALSILLGVLSIGSALMILVSRNIVYSAVYLSILGLLVASMIALLGLPTIGLIHVLIYVGAGVLFIVMSLSLIREEFSREEPKLRLLAILLAVILSIPLIYVSLQYDNRVISFDKPDYSYIAEYISYYPLMIMILALVFVVAMVSSISIVMKKRSGE